MLYLHSLYGLDTVISQALAVTYHITLYFELETRLKDTVELHLLESFLYLVFYRRVSEINNSENLNSFFQFSL